MELKKSVSKMENFHNQFTKGDKPKIGLIVSLCKEININKNYKMAIHLIPNAQVGSFEKPKHDKNMRLSA